MDWHWKMFTAKTLFCLQWLERTSSSSSNLEWKIRLLWANTIESVMPSSHLTLCRPLLLLPPIPLSIRVFTHWVWLIIFLRITGVLSLERKFSCLQVQAGNTDEWLWWKTTGSGAECSKMGTSDPIERQSDSILKNHQGPAYMKSIMLEPPSHHGQNSLKM